MKQHSRSSSDGGSGPLPELPLSASRTSPSASLNSGGQEDVLSTFEELERIMAKFDRTPVRIHVSGWVPERDEDGEPCFFVIEGVAVVHPVNFTSVKAILESNGFRLVHTPVGGLEIDPDNPEVGFRYGLDGVADLVKFGPEIPER